MFNLRLRSLLVVMGVAIVGVFGAASVIQQVESGQTAINSPQYGQIIRTKDLLADVLPPPAYLVEAYLEATLAVDHPENANVHGERLAQLKKDYLARHAFWSDRSLWASGEDFNEPLFKLITENSHAEAMKFWDTIEEQLLPALRSGDELAIDVAHDVLGEHYAAHRAHVDEIAKLAVEDQAKLEQVAASEISQTLITDLVVIAIGLLLTIGAFWFLYVRVIRPVTNVTGVMKKMSEGDLKSAAAGADRKDEVGDMVRALEVFRKNLLDMEAMRAEQAKNAEKVEIAKRESLREMAATVEAEANSAVSHVSEQASAMTRLAEAMAGSVSNVTDQCQGVAAAAEQAMMSATSVTAATQQFSASIQEVSQQLGRARSATAETVETSEKTRAAVSNLADAVAKIGDVANIISEIADQTDLLALNATIEAARAGEAGKGFAVVASEVKSLSGQTARSTEEIRRHVAGIQNVMRETIEIVAAIARQISNVDEGSSAIAAAMEEQTATIHEIARHVEETAKAASYVSESVGVVLKEAAKTGDGARSLSASVVDVDQSINLLQQAIIRVVRTSTPDVDRRTDTRFDVNATGTLVEKRQTVKIENLSRGGALLAPDADLRSGETGKLKVDEAQVPFKVLGRDKAGTHVQFDTKAAADFEPTLQRITKGAPKTKAG